jgi:hypothetical protein
MNTNWIVKKSVVLGLIVGVSAGAAAANTVEVTRCNILDSGTYVPVLVIDQDGSKSVFRIGQDGLTRQIVFNSEAALAWAGAKLGVTDITYRDCSATRDNSALLAVVVPDLDGEDTVGAGVGGAVDELPPEEEVPPAEVVDETPPEEVVTDCGNSGSCGSQDGYDGPTQEPIEMPPEEFITF